jgi:hypothetical protein
MARGRSTESLEKDRNRRYETTNGFALDIQRYLADEPVLACSPYREILRGTASRTSMTRAVSDLVPIRWRCPIALVGSRRQA